MSEKSHFLGDTPIKKTSEDLFNFKHYAEKVQKLIQANTNNVDPLTIGIYGKWGEGKTSFLKLIENKIDLWEKEDNQKGLLKYHFNPWRYSTEDEMLFDFFDGLANKMFANKEKGIEKVGRGILRVSRYLKAVKLSASAGLTDVNKLSASVDVGEIFKALGEDFSGEEITIDNLKELVNKSLKVANYKIIVFIDDIDRLDKDEIYTILKLIKLNASFENFVYLITLDSEHVSKAISGRYGQDKIDGELFLEKIINIPVHIPRIELEDLKNYFNVHLDGIRNKLNFLNKEKTDKEFLEIKNSKIIHYFKSPREIIRVLNSFFISAFSIGDEVNLEDLFFLETLKVQSLNSYEILKKYIYRNNSLSLTNVTIDLNDNINSKEKINGTRYEIKKTDENIFSIIEKLFPVKTINDVYSKNSYNEELMVKELRVNTIDNFDKYFSYHTKRKASNLVKFKLEEAIKNYEQDKIKQILTSLFEDANIPEYKIINLIEDFIKELDIKQGISDFCDFLIENINLIPVSDKDIYGLDNQLAIIELIAITLKNSKNYNEHYIFHLAKKLNSTQLCYFTRKFNEGIEVKESLKKLIVEKTKEEENKTNESFFLDPTEPSNLMKMQYWRKYEEETFDTFIDEMVDNKDKLLKLIRNFPTYWNQSYFGGIEKSQFQYMQSLLNVDMVYNKAKKIAKDTVNSINIDSYVFTPRDKSSEEENLEQFIFWYKKNKKENPQPPTIK